MPKRPDPRFPIPAPEKAEDYVLDLLGGIVRRRPLTGEEAMAQLIRLEELIGLCFRAGKSFPYTRQ